MTWWEGGSKLLKGGPRSANRTNQRDVQVEKRRKIKGKRGL